MSSTEAVPAQLHGMTVDEINSLTKDHNYGTWRYQKAWNPMFIADAEACHIMDGNGKRYLDFSSQLMCVNLGHKNPAVIESIAQQARELPYAMPGYATATRAELSKLLLDVLPEGLTKVFFTTSGTDANEAAFKIARMYTGKSKIIARYRQEVQKEFCTSCLNPPHKRLSSIIGLVELPPKSPRFAQDRSGTQRPAFRLPK